MEKRITSRITHSSEEERKYYHKKAKDLGYNSFVEFAKAAMDKRIKEENIAANSLRKIADIARDLEQILEIQSDSGELTEEEKQARSIAELIFNLAIHSDVMRNDPDNKVFITDEIYLEGDEPRWEYRYPLQKGFDVNDYINLKK